MQYFLIITNKFSWLSKNPDWNIESQNYIFLHGAFNVMLKFTFCVLLTKLTGEKCGFFFFLYKMDFESFQYRPLWRKTRLHPGGKDVA